MISDAQKGKDAAHLIWDDNPSAAKIKDPRTLEFAKAMITTSVQIFRSTPGLHRKMIKGAAASAEDLAVAQFQGIIEVIQNADDVRATEVRFALRDSENGRQLLIVHNGQPVTCHNVLGMVLPFLTTKTDRIDQRGRFGIGMKTLKRIAESVLIHSMPYHFSGDPMNFGWVSAENSIPNFYNPAQDTLLVAQLKAPFDEDALIEWFETWRNESLLFLASVSSFRWCELDGSTRNERSLTFSSWENVAFSPHHSSIEDIKHRQVKGLGETWTVWRATIEVPPHLHPAHKSRSEKTDISIALASGDTPPGLFIGFRTNITVSLTFSIDAQFDPSTSREAIIQNEWNNWLIDRTGEVIADISSGVLSINPEAAWKLIPIDQEGIGDENNLWLQGRFSSALQAARTHLSKSAMINLSGMGLPLNAISYESESLTGLLEEVDIERIANMRALHFNIRDNANRWREVMNTLGVSKILETEHLLEKITSELFSEKPANWWIEAASRLVSNHSINDLFGKRFLLSDQNKLVCCNSKVATERPLIFAVESSEFALRWQLFERLHPIFSESDAGNKVLTWLKTNAAFAMQLNAETELAAFAETFKNNSLEISDMDLRDLRRRFDELSDSYSELGFKVGAVLLVDGHLYHQGKIVRQKVRLSRSYLCKTLDGENSTWPDAAGNVADISWISARYENVLKTDVARGSRRKQDDGRVSRGPRRFLTFLGAEYSPRIVLSNENLYWGNSTRVAQLRNLGAERVEYDFSSPDLSNVLKHIQTLSKRSAKQHSPSLLRTLSRNWDRLYINKKNVPASHVTSSGNQRYRGEVSSTWLNELQNSKWIAVGRGELADPRSTVLRTPDTQAIYQTFASDISLKDIHKDMVLALKLITDIRVSDLLKTLEDLRNTEEVVDKSHTLQIYYAIARRCPKIISLNTRIGEITIQELRRRFLDGLGLIYVDAQLWQRPDQVMRGLDIFHGRRLFAPHNEHLANLWSALDVKEPTVDDCIKFCRELILDPYNIEVEAALMDVYRYMEQLLSRTEQRYREKLRKLPLYCNGGWTQERPIYLIEDIDVRNALIIKIPSLKCWKPPCEIRNFPLLTKQLGIEILHLEFKVESDESLASEKGEHYRLRFEDAVNHLSAELARSEPKLRETLSVSWDQLKETPLFIYDQMVTVRAKSSALSTKGVLLSLHSLHLASPLSFHFHEESIGNREYGGKIIASLFPLESRRRIDCEWAIAWQKSRDVISEKIRLASDEKRVEAMSEAAALINAAPKHKITVTPPKSRNSVLPPRTLKGSVGAMVKATVLEGNLADLRGAKQDNKKRGLRSTPPEAKGKSNGSSPIAPTAYTNTDLEQRGWEILEQALNTTSDHRLIDFRNRHGVGADGVFQWKRFVEMKATARGLQTQVEFSNNEFERAKQRGCDFILALVSGLETGYKDEVRLIFDPANCATIKPTNGVKLVALQDAPAVVIHFENVEKNQSESP